MSARLIFLVALSLFPQIVWAQAPAIEIQDAWIRAVPPGSTATAGFATLINRGNQAVELTAAHSALATEVKPMITTRKMIDGREVAGMEFVKSLTIPPGGRLILKPGGDHLMFLQLREVPRIGSEVTVTVQFGNQTQTLPFEVRKK